MYSTIMHTLTHYVHTIIQAIAKGAESLFLTVTQKASVLGDLCHDGVKNMYGELVQQLVVAATRLSQEVSSVVCIEKEGVYREGVYKSVRRGKIRKRIHMYIHCRTYLMLSRCL